jgi:hypothetical protein
MEGVLPTITLLLFLQVYTRVPTTFVTVPEVTVPPPPKQSASVCVQAVMARANGSLMVTEQVSELQSSLTVSV